MNLVTTKRRGRNPWKKLIINIKASGRMRDAHCNREPRKIAVTWEDLRDIFIDQQAKCYWFNMVLDPDNIFDKYNPLAISADRLDDEKGYTHDNVVICSRMANLGRGKCEADKFRQICHRLQKDMWHTQEQTNIENHIRMPAWPQSFLTPTSLENSAMLSPLDLLSQEEQSSESSKN